MTYYKKAIGCLFTGAVQFIGGIIEWVFAIIFLYVQQILFLFALGVGLTLAGYAFMNALPALIAQSDLVALQLDLESAVLTSFYNAIAVLIDAVKAIESISSNRAVTPVKFIDYHVYPASEVREVLQGINANCKVGAPFEAVSRVYRVYTQKYACALVRVTAAVPGLYPFSSSVVSGLGLYEGSAYPDVSALQPDEGNCGLAPPSGNDIAVCAAINIGSFLIVLLIVFIIGTLVWYCYKSIFNIVKGVFLLIYSLGITLHHSIEEFIDAFSL
jgi:hypothetical protein